MHTSHRLLAAATLLSAYALFSAPSVLGAELTPTRCNPQLLATPTDFPTKSQSQGEHGIVQLRLTLTTDGRATDVQVAQSSGYRTLDKATVSSVRDRWRFDVAHCSADDLSAAKTVAVTFNLAPRYTLASTLNIKSLVHAKALAADQRCDANETADGSTVFTCINDTTLNLARSGPAE